MNGSVVTRGRCRHRLLRSGVPVRTKCSRIVAPKEAGAASAPGPNQDLAGQRVNCQECHREDGVEQSRGHKSVRCAKGGELAGYVVSCRQPGPSSAAVSGRLKAKLPSYPLFLRRCIFANR